MFESIKNQKVLVTGASTGIGASIAKLFASYGADVGLHYRGDTESARATKKEVESYGVKAEMFKGDLLDKRIRNNLVRLFVEKFGQIDVLVNNAGGYYKYEMFSNLDEDSWNKTIMLNATAPFVIARNAYIEMERRKCGRVINISTTAIKYAGAKSLHYIAAKAAMETVAVGMAREGAKCNVLVNTIRCGVIDTPMRTKLEGYNEQQFLKRVALIPLQRMGEGIDVARMALFLASESGDFITGETFTVAGGD